MVMTNSGKEKIALCMGGSLTMTNTSWYLGIGTGSQAATVVASGLVTETDRNAITGSADVTTAKKVSQQYDFNSVEMSGTLMTELATFDNTSGGKCWMYEYFSSLTFNGNQELQVDIRKEIT